MLDDQRREDRRPGPAGRGRRATPAPACPRGTAARTAARASAPAIAFGSISVSSAEAPTAPAAREAHSPPRPTPPWSHAHVDRPSRIVHLLCPVRSHPARRTSTQNRLLAFHIIGPRGLLAPHAWRAGPDRPNRVTRGPARICPGRFRRSAGRVDPRARASGTGERMKRPRRGRGAAGAGRGSGAPTAVTR